MKAQHLIFYPLLLVLLPATVVYGNTDPLDPLGVEENSLQNNVEEIKNMLKTSVERVFKESDYYKERLEEIQRQQVADADKDRDQDIRIETAAIERKFMTVKIGLLEKKGEDDRKIITLLAEGVNKSLAHVADEEQNAEKWKWGLIACGLSVLSGCVVYLMTRKF